MLPVLVKPVVSLTWVGGEVGYPSGGKVFYLTMPALRAELSAEQKNNKNLLHVNLINNQDKRLGDLYIDGDNMLRCELNPAFTRKYARI